MRPIRKPLTEPGRDRRERTRAPIAGQSRASSPAGILRDDDDVERQPAGDREVDAALHDDERLAERRDRERRGERQHRQQRAPLEARRREQEARREQRDRRHDDGREAARQQAPRSRAERRPSTRSRRSSRVPRRHKSAILAASRSVYKWMIASSVRLRDPVDEVTPQPRAWQTRRILCIMGASAPCTTSRDGAAGLHGAVFARDEHCTELLNTARIGTPDRCGRHDRCDEGGARP